MTASLPERMQALLAATEGRHTPGTWYYQHGHGIEVWEGGTCGLLIYAEAGCAATPNDQELMAAAPTLRALLAEMQAENARLRGALVSAERGFEHIAGLAGRRNAQALQEFAEAGHYATTTYEEMRQQAQIMEVPSKYAGEYAAEVRAALDGAQ